MRADQPRHALPRSAGSIDRRDDGGVVTGENFQEQRAGQFLLRSEEMEEAAVGRPRAGSDGGHGGALETVAVEYRQSRRQKILACRRHSRPSRDLDYYSRAVL